MTRSFSLRDALLKGALIGGTLTFLPGFVLPIVFEPDNNQGPLTGFLTAPFGAVFGSLVGLLMFLNKPSLVMAFLIGGLSGVVLVTGTGLAIAYMLGLSGADFSRKDVFSILAPSFLILGTTGLCIRLLEVKRSKGTPGRSTKGQER